MKNIRILLLTLLSLIFFTACFAKFPYDAPYGTWKSEEPEIIINITSKTQMESRGTYNKDGEIRGVFLTFNNFPAFMVQDNEAHYYSDVWHEWVTTSEHWYFDGRFEVKDDKLYYYARWSGLTGQGTGQRTRTIVFERADDDAQE